MGGRGSSFGVETIQAIGNAKAEGVIEPLIVADMNPMDKGSRFTNPEKTLNFIESKKMSYTKEQLQVLDDHGYVTRAFQGDEHSVSVDADTRRYMEGKVVTHNHPDVYGGTFSDADIRMLSAGMKEMRASAKEGIYSMKVTEKADPSGFSKNYEKDSKNLQAQMYEISKDVAKRKWKSYEEFRQENRKKQLAVIDGWYKKNAEKFGFIYTFYPNN